MMKLNSNLPFLISLDIHATLLLHFPLSCMTTEKQYYQIYILNVVYFVIFINLVLIKYVFFILVLKILLFFSCGSIYAYFCFLVKVAFSFTFLALWCHVLLSCHFSACFLGRSWFWSICCSSYVFKSTELKKCLKTHLVFVCHSPCLIMNSFWRRQLSDTIFTYPS